MIGAIMRREGALTSRGSATVRVQKAPHQKRRAYPTVIAEPRAIVIQIAASAGAVDPMRPWRAVSFATKPMKPGAPAIERAARPERSARRGMRRPRPVSSRRSRVPVAQSIAPTVRKSAALKSEWATSMARPASMSSCVP